MSKSGQLEFPSISEAAAWQDMLREVRRIVVVVGHGEVAYQLGMSDGALSNALEEREWCAIKLRHLPYLLRHRGGSDELPRIITDVCGLELAAPKPLTAAEKLARLEEALGRSGAAGQAIIADAYGRRR